MSGARIWMNGRQLAKTIIGGIKQNLEHQRELWPSFYQINPQWNSPRLAIINVGADTASLSYIRNKIKLASNIGVNFQLHQFMGEEAKKSAGEEGSHLFSSFPQGSYHLQTLNYSQPQRCVSKVSQLIEQLNKNTGISGILLQLPLEPPLGLFAKKLIRQINPSKDVDCLTPTNRARLLEESSPQLMPCTPAGVLRILKEYGVDLCGKRVTIVGRSELVGLPLFHLLLNMNATVTLCHSKTLNLNSITAEADIVISAVGKPNFINCLKPDAIAIDVGISRGPDGKLSGDISQRAKRGAALGTPVPGGVGPLTVAMLMQNTVYLWRKQMEIYRGEVITDSF